MPTLEIFNKCLPKTSAGMGAGGVPDITWEDVLLAIQGSSAKHFGFVRFVYMDDPAGRHDFYAGLYQETMNRADVQDWWKRQKYQKHAVENLVILAINEWKHGKRHRYTDTTRAHAYGVSRGVWSRHYKHIYSQVAAIPALWQSDILGLLNDHFDGIE